MRYTISTAAAILGLGAGLGAGLAGSLAARAEVPSVVTDIPPVGALAAQVMGDLGVPQVLLTGGADPHDFQLRPSQARGLAGAGLVIWVGPALTPWLDRALDSTRSGPALALLEVEGTHTRQFSAEDAAAEEAEHAHEEGEDHDHDADQAADHEDHDGHEGEEHAHDHEGHDDHGHEGHSHIGTDPHAWLDPGNALVWLDAIAVELGRLDPEHAAVYTANAETAKDGIRKLDQEVAAKLAPVKDRPFVTFHAAFGYFDAHYGLTQLGAIAEGDAASPGAARLKALRDSVKGADVCIFPEVQHDPVLVRQMAEATGAKLGEALDPEGSSLPVGPDAYAALLTGLADNLTACLDD